MKSVFSKLPSYSKLPIYVLSGVWFVVTAPRSVRRLTHKLVG
jgi:hypothetical protein